MTKTRQFRPHWLLTVIAVVLVAVTLKLALWQFDRAAEKRLLESAAVSAMTAAAITLRTDLPVKPFQHAALVGKYLPENEILLDNRILHKRVGYHVATAFELVGGDVVMVKRGWLAGTGRRNVLPVIPPPEAGLVTVRGVFYTDEAQAFVLSDEKPDGVVRQWLHLSDYAKETGLPLMTLAFIRQGTAADNMPPVSVRTDFKSVRSTGYAWQWLTFCLLAIIFYILLGRRAR